MIESGLPQAVAQGKIQVCLRVPIGQDRIFPSHWCPRFQLQAVTGQMRREQREQRLDRLHKVFLSLSGQTVHQV